jgi:tetratricopeptide (TPR) repeat protein
MRVRRTVIAVAAALIFLPIPLIGSDAARDEDEGPKPGSAASSRQTPGESDATAEDRALLRRALEIVTRAAKSDDIHALRSVARVQVETGDRDASKETFRRAIAVAEKSPQPESRVYGLLFVARSQAALGDKEEARETLRRALAAAPEVTDLVGRVATLAFAAQTQVEADDRQGGNETLARAIALQQSLPDRDPNGGNLNVRLTAQHRIVAALVELGEPDRAIELAANDPDSVNVSLLHVADALPKMKDRDRARAILQRALEIAARSHFPGERGQALAKVAEAQAALGDFDAAVATARRLAEGPDASLNQNYLSSALRAAAAASATPRRAGDR